jgi:hypothetical protein
MNDWSSKAAFIAADELPPIDVIEGNEGFV